MKNTKSAETLRKRKEAQREQHRAQVAEKEAIHRALTDIVNDYTASPSERLHAAELLLNGN